MSVKKQKSAKGSVNDPFRSDFESIYKALLQGRSAKILQGIDPDRISSIAIHLESCLPDILLKGKFFKAFAERAPLAFLMFLFFPFIVKRENSTGQTAKINHDDKKVLDWSIRGTVAAISSANPSTREKDKETLLLYFKAFAPYAFQAEFRTKTDPEQNEFSPWRDTDVWAQTAFRLILQGLAEVIGRGPDPLIRFTDLADIEQAYWNCNVLEQPNPLAAHRTVRMNALPFAESVILHRMVSLARDQGINLELVEVPWDHVGRALLTNRIDIAFYSKAIAKQLRELKHELEGRILYRSSKTAMVYHRYYLLRRNPKLYPNTGLPRFKVAVVANSDHETVLEYLLTSPSTAIRKKLRRIGLPVGRFNVKDLECVVSNPDDAVEHLVNGDGGVTHCLAGGIHYQYIKNHLAHCIDDGDTVRVCKDAFKAPADEGQFPTELRFFTVSRSSKDAAEFLRPIAAIWSAFDQDWNHLRHGMDGNQELKKRRIRCAVHVNRDPKKVFVSNWPELRDLITDHNQFFRDIGDPEKVDLEKKP